MSGPRYVTLRDYLRVLRAHRALILLVAIVIAGAAYLVTNRQDKVYVAEASLVFRDSGEALDLLGTPSAPRRSQAENATVNAERIDTPTLASRVRKALRVRETATSLREDTSVGAEALTNFVVIQARSESPEFAARLANAWARQAEIVESRRVRKRYDETAEALRREYKRETGGKIDPFSKTLLNERVSRVETIKDIIDPIEIARFAEVPDSADSPKPIRNMLLGLLVGLTLGGIAAFVRDSLDVRLRGAEQAHAHLGLPVVGHVSEDALGSAVTGTNGRQPSARDADAFHILRANLAFLDSERPPRSVAVTSPLAAEGKSTVAASLAWSHATSGQRALLVECDLRRPSLAARLGLNEAPGLSDYIADRASSQEIIQTVNLSELGSTNGPAPDSERALPPARLDCITAGGSAPRPAELLGSPAFRDFLAVVSRSYDMTVLDCSPLLSVVDTLELLPYVDAIVVCIRSGRTTRDQARAARAALERFPRRPTGLVLTGARPGKSEYYYYTGATTGA